jgi:D-alanyl-D-alanine carboxypeptidase
MMFGVVAGASAQPRLQAALQSDLATYLKKRGAVEHISAASASVSLARGAVTINAAAGVTRFGGRQPVTPASLFQIGFNTKAFTSVILLQLEAEHRLTMEDTVGKWLPQYPAWKTVTITRLLNMTSGIVGYDTVPAMLADFAKAPYRTFTAKELVAYSYPSGEPPALSHVWAYSNTAYILAQMIIERATGHTYDAEIHHRLLGPDRALPGTFYATSFYPTAVTARMVSGYFHSHDPDNAPLAPLYGRDVKPFSLSWTQAAGGIVSSPAEVAHWVRRLYTGPVLKPAQRRELMTIVSNATGKPIATTTIADPKGFGLGVGQITQPAIGTIWFYEGETLGYRVIYGYFPRRDVVIAVGLNSQPDAKDDHIGELLKSLYATLHAAGKL